MLIITLKAVPDFSEKIFIYHLWVTVVIRAATIVLLIFSFYGQLYQYH